MRNLLAVTACALAISAGRAEAAALPVGLRTATSFVVLAGSAVTNTGATTLRGNVGVWPGTSATELNTAMLLTGTQHIGNAYAMQAQDDLTAAYDFAAGQRPDMDLTDQDLGGMTLRAGVYSFASSAQLTGTLTLDAQNDPGAAFVFQISSTLTTASNAAVRFINGDVGDRVFWQVGSSATLGTDTDFAGSILALTSITLNTGADIACGRALARNGAVTLDTNSVANDGVGCGGATIEVAVPEPASATLLVGGLLLSLALAERRRPGPCPSRRVV